jgi:hypothetical protein
MTKLGIVSQKLLHGLLGYGNNNDNCEMLTALMLKYGLLVSWKRRDYVDSRYFVPALFPLDTSVSTRIDVMDQQAWAQGKPVSTVFVVFSLRKTLLGSGVCVRDLAKHCFLPSGLFDRLLCKLLEWSQHSRDIDPASFRLNKNVAVMRIANVPFRLVWRSACNCIELNTTSLTPITLMRRLETILTRLLRESVQSLYLQSAILAKTDAPSGMSAWRLLSWLPVGINNLNSLPDSWLVPVGGCMASTPPTSFPSLVDGAETVIDHTSIVLQHRWLSYAPQPGRFNVFLSHRWGDCDDSFVAALHDRLSDYVVNGVPLSAFYDANHMKTGYRIDREFFSGLLGSMVVVPIVSVNSLQRILSHSPDNLDNVLVEWLTTLVVISYPAHFRVLLRTVVPLCFSDSSGYDYFSSRSRLPNTVPTATCTAVLDLFRMADIVLPDTVIAFVKGITVKNIVEGIMTSMCVTVDMNKSLADVISECTAEIMQVILQ